MSDEITPYFKADFWVLEETLAWLKGRIEHVVAQGHEIQSAGLSSDMSVDPVREGESISRVWSAHVRARPQETP